MLHQVNDARRLSNSCQSTLLSEAYVIPCSTSSFLSTTGVKILLFRLVQVIAAMPYSTTYDGALNAKFVSYANVTGISGADSCTNLDTSPWLQVRLLAVIQFM